MILMQDKLWTRLVECTEPFYSYGVLFKFKTIRTAGNGYKYALGVKLDLREDLSFIGFDGRGWGYGNSTLPESARYGGERWTVSRAWIAANFDHIVIPDDTNDVWVCKKAKNFIRSLTSYEDL